LTSLQDEHENEKNRSAQHRIHSQWIAASDSRTPREVERLVAHRKRGDRPSDEPSQVEERKRVSLRIRPDTYALLAEARKKLCAQTGESLEDDDLVAMMARAVLGGGAERDEGKSNYRIGLTVCEQCSKATQHAGGEELPVDDVTVQMALCDAQHIGRIDGTAELVRASQSIPPKVRRAVAHRHGGRCAVPGCTNACFVDQHHVLLRSEGGTHDPKFILVVCQSHHRAAHDGRLAIRGDAERGFVFEHADGTPYGCARTDAHMSQVTAEVFGALCAMGFRHKDARAMLDGARASVRADAGRDELIRAALARAPLTCVRETSPLYGDADSADEAPLWGRASRGARSGPPRLYSRLRRFVPSTPVIVPS
jgi:hypothetical protein